MACLFYSLSISIIFNVFFLLITASPSLAETNKNTIYVNFGRKETWYCNNSEIMDGGWKMTMILSMKNQSLGFYFGLYSSEMTNGRYMLAVVAVGEGRNTTSHTVVWSSDRNQTMEEYSYARLASDGFVLVNYRVNYWALHPKFEYFEVGQVTGIKLTEEGNLILLGNEDSMIWQSFNNPLDTLLVGQRLYHSQKLINYKGSFARLTEDGNFSVFLNTTDDGPLIYYQISLDQNSRDLNGLRYAPDLKDGSVINLGNSQRLRPLEFIEFIKLDSDGRLRRYRYENSREEVVDMITSQCQTSQARSYLREVRDQKYFNFNSTKAATKSIATTLSECQRACMQNCSCSTVLFSYEDDVSNGSCYISSGIFSLGGGQINYNKSLAFIKVPNANGGLSPDAFSPTLPSTSRHRKKLAAIISALTAGGLIMIIIIVLVSHVMLRKKRLENDGEDGLKQVPGMQLRFTFEDLEIATENFKEKLGIGGFGTVFKGVLPDGTKIAVKRLEKMSQGMREFLAEVETIGKLHHFNLVPLVGYCAEKSCRLLVYEYMSNGSLDNWIFNRDQAPSLDWQGRKKIILGIAKGLAYLHEYCRQKIIHLDIKPHNILLDENFNAKVSDFGLSKLIERDMSHVLIPMRGTPGYLAPELQHSKVTVKADVYSFGVVILEIVSKRRNVDSSRSDSSFHLLKMLQKKADEDQLIDIVEDLDEDMQINREEVEKMIRIGAWCLQNDHTKRPSMSTVVKVLEGVSEVELNVSYKFHHAMSSAAVANDHITVAPQTSVLSAPR